MLVLLLGGTGWAIHDDAQSIFFITESYDGMRDAGIWLRERVDRDTRVAAYKPYVSFWANCRHVRYAKESTPHLIIEAARLQGAQYFIVNVNVAHRLVPVLRPLLATPPADLAERVTPVKIFSYEGRSMQNTAIYRIKNPLPAEAIERRGSR